VIDAIEDGAGTLRDVRLHQMLPLRDRRSRRRRRSSATSSYDPSTRSV
jgi:hypothetical protein